MKTTARLVILLCAATKCLILTAGAHASQCQGISHETTEGLCALESFDNPQVIYFGSRRGLYKTEDAGSNWRCVTTTMNTPVYDIAQDRSDARHIFIATSKGIFTSSDAGISWRQAYRTKTSEQAASRSIALRGRTVCVATDKGFIFSSDSGTHWNTAEGYLGTIKGISVDVEPADNGYWYAAAIDGIYRMKTPCGRWDKVFNATLSDALKDEDSQPPDETIEGSDISYGPVIRALCVDSAHPGTLYIATVKGIFISHDSALTWETLSYSSVSTRHINAMAVDREGKLYAADGSDIYVYSAGSWQRLDCGINIQGINSLYAGASALYAASEKGLFRVQYGIADIPCSGGNEDEYTRGLPTISAVQAAAIEYADADIRKIRQWRKEAQHKALLPVIDIAFNKDASDLWHWEGGSTTKENDDILHKGKNVYEWDVCMKWDLADLVWNDAQTSIDTRSRLLVQLRSDVIDEVTKLYFEYVRVRMEMDSLTLMDKNKLAQKAVRLKEIAAQLDGLTGNFFTRR